MRSGVGGTQASRQRHDATRGIDEYRFLGSYRYSELGPFRIGTKSMDGISSTRKHVCGRQLGVRLFQFRLVLLMLTLLI